MKYLHRVPPCLIVVILVLNITSFNSCQQKEKLKDTPRERILFDSGWKFFRGDNPEAVSPEFDDSIWKAVDIPHDWSISGPYAKDNPSGHSGGFAPGGIGWYRKTFKLARHQKAKLISLEFGGIYMNSEVWINGHYLGKRPYGYISFNYKLTPYLNFDGDNVIAVHVDNSLQPSARWYTGSGIYRHVWLVVTSKLHIARHGVYITTPEVSPESSTIEIKTKIENEFTNNKKLSLVSELYSPDDKLVAMEETPVEVGSMSESEIKQRLTLGDPSLWSPDEPNLYKVKSLVKNEGIIIDEQETNIGIREFRFTADSGFFLNGENMKLKGVNNHSDLGALGAALNNRVLERRLEILKAMGCNAIRTAHNPPSEELLDMCDRMGFVVMDEAFDEWLESWPWTDRKQEGKAKYGYHLYFNEWAEKDLVELIRRDRNHPSVILWSVGNEIPDACYEIGTERLKEMMEIVRNEDPTRPVTCGITHMHLANESGFASQLDITGYNGGGGSCFMYEQDHETYPERRFVATEVPHSFQTRGIYRTKSWYRGKNPLGGIMKVPDLTEEELFPDIPRYYSSSYDNAMVRISARDSWRRTRDFPYISGEFRWTGFDYLGETMYGWPARFWNFGVIDMCGFPKDTYYFYQSQWTENPMVHIFPHWNWERMEGIEIPVAAYSNCESIELFLNGKSLGQKEMADKMNLVWNVPYQPGTLKALAKNNGSVVSEMEIHTAGEPAGIELLADRITIIADGQDVVHVEVNIIDKNGNIVPDASNEVRFSVEGQGNILAVDNGDPMSQESFNGNIRKAFNGKCLMILKSTETPGRIEVSCESEGLTGAKLTVSSKQ